MMCSEFPLPTELLELIFSFISHDIASLRRLLPVCRAFAPVARRYLYREIILLDDKNDPERSVQTPNPIFTISEASFISLPPSIGHFVKAVRICGSTRPTKQKTHVTSKRLHLILPRLVSLQSISFQRTRPGPWYRRGCVRRRYGPYMLMTAEIAKAIPRSVHTVWLSKVRFESEAAVDVFFGACRGLAHLGLDQVSVLDESEGSLAKRVWSMIFPSKPSIPLGMEPIELRSYAHGNDVFLPRLPFTDSENAPYFKLSSVTSLKLYCWDTVPIYWETLLRHTVSTVHDLMIATALYGIVYRRTSVWHLAGHKRLRALFIVLFDFLPETPFPDTLQHLTILVYTRDSRVAWGELDAYLDRLPSLCSVEILFLDSYYPLIDFVDFCTSTWARDFGAGDACMEEVVGGMPLLSQRGILSVKQLKDMDG